MEIKFDNQAAHELIIRMDQFCRSIENNGKELLSIISDTNSNWNDKQFDAFRNSIEALIGDLDRILKLDGEFITTFAERVKELES